MNREEIINAIQNAIPAAKVTLHSDDDVHFSVEVVSPHFEGMSRIKQHQCIYDALGNDLMGMHALSIHTFSQPAKEQLTTQEVIQSYITQDAVVLFMKGTPEQPMCGFSSVVVQMLKTIGMPFEAYNVLESDELRQGIKDFSNWPTIPQLYIKGEFIGGCDIVKELYQSGELETLLV